MTKAELEKENKWLNKKIDEAEELLKKATDIIERFIMREKAND